MKEFIFYCVLVFLIAIGFVYSLFTVSKSRVEGGFEFGSRPKANAMGTGRTEGDITWNMKAFGNSLKVREMLKRGGNEWAFLCVYEKRNMGGSRSGRNTVYFISWFM